MLAKDWQQVILRDKTELYNQAHEGRVLFLLKPHNALQVFRRDDSLFDETLAKGHIVLHFRLLPRTSRRVPLVRPKGPRQADRMTGQPLYSRGKPRTTGLRPWLWGNALTGTPEHSSPYIRTGRSVVQGKYILNSLQGRSPQATDASLWYGVYRRIFSIVLASNPAITIL